MHAAPMDGTMMARDPGEGDRLKAALDAPLRIAIITTDLSGTITAFGRGAALMLDVDAEAMLGTPLSDICSLGTAEALARSAAVSGDVAPVETRYRGAGSLPLDVSRTVAPIAGPGGTPTGYLVIASDITEVVRRERGTEALRRIATAVAHESSPAALVGLAAREAAQLLRADAAGLVRFDGDDAVDMGSWHAGVRRSPAGRRPLTACEPVAAVRRGDAMGRGPTPVADEGLGASSGSTQVAVPVVAAGRLWGALWLTWPMGAPAVTLPSEQIVLGRIAELLGIAIAAAEAREWIVSEALADALDPDADLEHALGLIAAAARRALNADRVSFYILGDDDLIDRVVTTETDPRMAERLRGVIGRPRDLVPLWRDVLYRDDVPLIEVPDLAAEPRVPEHVPRALGVRGLAVRHLEHPLMLPRQGRRALGGLLVGYRDPHVLTARERITLESLAGVSATVLANERLRSVASRARDERELVDTDPLTGLLNHRAFQERFQEALDAARRRGGPLALALFDVDRFRRVNEGFGHDVGDRVLREVCARVRAHAGPDDILGRVGGEEIAWVTFAEPVDAWRDADRMREAIAADPFHGVGSVTVSAGVSERTGGATREEMMQAAEDAMQWAKQHGRNAAFLSTPEMREARSDEDRGNRLARSQALQSIRVLARAVDAKDPSTRRHTERVADLAVSLATALGWPTERMVRLREAGLVHDVGKVGIPDAILFKAGPLTPEERVEINRHATIGAEMVADVLTDEQVRWVRGHHERWDGGGYPDGLAREDIPDGARILAVADAWDVMTSVRPYNPTPLDVERALAECRACAGTQFAPTVVEALGRIVAAGALPRVRERP